MGANVRGYGFGGGDTGGGDGGGGGGGGGRMVEAEVTPRAAQGRENGVRECDEESGCTVEGERSSERERRTRTDDPEI